MLGTVRSHQTAIIAAEGTIAFRLEMRAARVIGKRGGSRADRAKTSRISVRTCDRFAVQ
jgi:hypothetical protein